MKKRLLLVALCAGFLASSPVFAMDLDVVEGNFDPLVGVTSYALELKFDGMIVKKQPEADYTSKKVADYNAKEAGKGDKFLTSWKYGKSTIYPESFELLFNKTLEEYKVVISKNGAKYKIIVNTTMMEPGWNVGIMRAAAVINADISIVETKNPSKVIVKLKAVKVPGRDAGGFDYDESVRVRESYAKLAKEIAKMLEDEVYDK